MIVVHPVSQNQIRRRTHDARQSEPGGVVYSSAGNGSTGHVAGELLGMRAGVRVAHMPYREGAPALHDLLADQIHTLVTALPTVEAMPASGKLRALAVTSSKRLKAMPNVPTLAEFYPGYEVCAWYGLLASSGTPDAILQKLNPQAVQILARKDVRERFEALGVEAVGGTPQAFSEKIKSGTDKWAKVVK